jgi:hypothetical protein
VCRVKDTGASKVTGVKGAGGETEVGGEPVADTAGGGGERRCRRCQCTLLILENLHVL